MVMEMYYCRPDGKKKAYVQLTSDHDALDVANKVRENIVVLTIDDDQHLVLGRLDLSKSVGGS